MKLPRFSLRALFVLVALAAIPMGWVAYQLNWIRQRHGFLDSHASTSHKVFPNNNLPWSLRLFGESPLTVRYIAVDRSEFAHAKKLFPEGEFDVFAPSFFKPSFLAPKTIESDPTKGCEAQ
jgi:hypothetical protein